MPAALVYWELAERQMVAGSQVRNRSGSQVDLELVAVVNIVRMGYNHRKTDINRVAKLELFSASRQFHYLTDIINSFQFIHHFQKPVDVFFRHRFG